MLPRSGEGRSCVARCDSLVPIPYHRLNRTQLRRLAASVPSSRNKLKKEIAEVLDVYKLPA